jgi:hypothetical protein
MPAHMYKKLDSIFRKYHSKNAIPKVSFHTYPELSIKNANLSQNRRHFKECEL